MSVGKLVSSLCTAAGLTAAFVLAGPASAATAAASASTVRPSVTCSFKVVWVTAGVYAQPDVDSTQLATKRMNDTVGGSCTTAIGPVDGYTYQQVVCGCGSTGSGWMRKDALSPSHP